MVPPALRLESDCGPSTYICNIDLILVLFVLLPSLLRNVVQIMAERLDGSRCRFTEISEHHNFL